MSETLLDFEKPNLFKIGVPSYDWSTYILFRTTRDLDIHKYPNTVGISVSALQELIEHQTKLIIIKVNGIKKWRTTPDDWLHKSTIDTLNPQKGPHAFIKIDKLGRL
jgi:uncharacterized membrane protein YjdF